MAKKILIAFESDDFRDNLISILNFAGYEVKEASNGADALLILKADSIDLLLSDTNMPEIDGITLLKIIREQNEYRNLPIIILTDETDDDIITDARLNGANAWISKPFQSEQLENVVKKYMKI